MYIDDDQDYGHVGAGLNGGILLGSFLSLNMEPSIPMKLTRI
jgi:hypothetical protein